MGQMDGVKKHNQDLAKQKRTDVQLALDRLIQLKEPFTKADICREANVSRAYFTKHPDMDELVCRYVSNTNKALRSKDTNETYIKILKEEIADLKKEKTALVNQCKEGLKYKKKYEDALLEIASLKESLEKMYLDDLDVNL